MGDRGNINFFHEWGEVVSLGRKGKYLLHEDLFSGEDEEESRLKNERWGRNQGYGKGKNEGKTAHLI